MTAFGWAIIIAAIIMWPLGFLSGYGVGRDATWMSATGILLSVRIVALCAFGVWLASGRRF